MFAAHPWNVLRLDAAEVSYVAAPICFCIGVDELMIKAGFRNSQPIIIAHDWRCVDNKGYGVAFA